MDKAGVFIDGGFLSMLTKYLFPAPGGGPRKIDMQKFSDNLCLENTCELLRTYYYTCPPFQSYSPTDEEKERKKNYDSWLSSLKRLPKMQIREGRLMKTYGADGKPDFIQKGVDVLIATDMLKLATKQAIQKVILLSSDSDFVPVVRLLRDEGATVVLYYVPGKTGFSQHLFDECDERREITVRLLEKAQQDKKNA